MHKYSQQEKDFLRDIAPGCCHSEITQLFNAHFGLDMPKSSIMSTCFRYGYKNGIDCKLNQGYEPTQFKKGHEPANKGTKGFMQANITSFRKGNAPKNYRPVGSERITVDGYIEVKVEHPKKWRMKHVVVWEAANGAVEKGNVIIFADGDKKNIKLDNLILATRAELAIMNKHGFISSDAELTKTGMIVADIYLKIGEKKKKSAT